MNNIDSSNLTFSREKLSSFIEESGITQAELSRRICGDSKRKDRKIINKILKQQRGMSADELIRLCAISGKSALEFAN